MLCCIANFLASILKISVPISKRILRQLYTN